MAEIWRDVLLFDPDLRGQFSTVIFAFEDAAQSTTRLILEEIAKDKKGAAKGRSRDGSGASGSSSSRGLAPTDISIFQRVFEAGEIERVLSRPNPRYGLSMITS